MMYDVVIAYEQHPNNVPSLPAGWISRVVDARKADDYDQLLKLAVELSMQTSQAMADPRYKIDWASLAWVGQLQNALDKEVK
jgi:hypothetical protein